MKITNPKVAIVGCTGVVGTEMLNVLKERNFPYAEIRLLASANSAGELYEFDDQELIVEELNENSFENIDIALFATSAELSAKYVPFARKAGAISIDNSSHFRMDPAIPLVVPEVNAHTIKAEDYVIANPNCSTIQLVPVLKALEGAVGLKRVVVSTYQAVSGAGKAAMEELWQQTVGILNQKEVEPEAFSHQIAFNCIPQIDVFREDGYTKEEFKVMNESRKILELPELPITCTAVRVPVFNSHAESVNVELKNDLSWEDLIALLKDTPGVKVFADAGEYPLQINVSGTDDIYVGRIRRDTSVPFAYNFWIVADNLKKGAALNAVQIAELFVNPV